MAKWRITNGRLVPAPGQEHWGATPPEPVGLTPGEPPHVHVGAAHRKDNRRFDKPSESQIKDIEREDQAYFDAQVDIGAVHAEVKKDLASGKIQIDPSVIDSQSGRVTPFGSVEEPDGVTRIVPQNKVPRPARTPEPKPPSTQYVDFTVPTPVSPRENHISLKDQVKRGFRIIADSNGEHLRRTF